jgi:hypothetical protein
MCQVTIAPIHRRRYCGTVVSGIRDYGLSCLGTSALKCHHESWCLLELTPCHLIIFFEVPSSGICAELGGSRFYQNVGSLPRIVFRHVPDICDCLQVQYHYNLKLCFESLFAEPVSVQDGVSAVRLISRSCVHCPWRVYFFLQCYVISLIDMSTQDTRVSWCMPRHQLRTVLWFEGSGCCLLEFSRLNVNVSGLRRITTII